MPASFNPNLLTLTPYGVSVFTDTERSKSFVTLHYRREGSEKTVIVLPLEVLDDLEYAGLTIVKAMQIEFTPKARGCRCYLKADVRAASGDDAALLAWAKDKQEAKDKQNGRASG